MKKKIYLSGGWGYGNKGDNAILEAMLCTIKSRLPEYSVLVTSHSTSEIKENHGVDSIVSVHKLVGKRNPLAILRWIAIIIWRVSGHRIMLSSSLNKQIKEIRSSEVFIMGGGGYFNDAWPDMLRARCLELEMAESVDTPIFLYGQTIGPFSTETIDSVLKRRLKNVMKIAHRDIQSRDVLIAASVPEAKFKLSADEANLLELREGVVAKTAGRVLVGVMIQHYRRHLGVHGPSPIGSITSEQLYFERLVASLNELQKSIPEIDYIFIPSTSWDEDICEKIFLAIKKNAGSATLLPNPVANNFISACQAVDFMISTNMHPIIIAATASKPSIALSYHYKLDDYMNSIGLEKYILRLDDFTKEEFVELARDMISNKGVADIVHRRHFEVKKLARVNGEMLEELLGRNADCS